MAVPNRILVIYVVVCLCPGPSWSQYAMLKKKDLDVSLFDTDAFENEPSICSNQLQKQNPNYFRYLQPLSDYLYVGAMNCLLRLHQANLTHKDSRNFPVDHNDHWKCTIQGKKDTPDCQNHIRAVMPDVHDENKLFVCGTGGYAPRKYSLNDTNLNESDPKEDGSKYCPFDPLDNVTSIHIQGGNLGNKPAHYFGLYGDFIKHLPVLFRPSFNISVYPDLVSAKGDVTWLNAPQFVGSFNVDDAVKGNQVFFFFREIAEEYSASKTKIFSRVAKVCKNDHGGGSIERNQKKWLSYQKARLNCSLPGFEPYYWDDIYDVYEAGDKFYALFYKQGGDHNSSAICVYTKSEIFRVFGGSFRYIVNKAWLTLPANQHPNPRLDDCYIHDTNPSVFEGPQTVSRYQLMELNVNSLYGRPIYSKTGVQFLKIVVHPDKEGSGSNIYLATDSGEVYSLFLYDCDEADFQLEENAVWSPLDDPHPVWSMKLLESQSSIYLGTDYEVAKFNFSVCTKYKKKDSCIHDVLCSWCNDTDIKACIPRDFDSCSKKVTYNDVYKTESGQCQVSDIVKVLDEEVVPIPQLSMKGLFITLDVNYGLQRAGPTFWTKNNEDISFGESERFFLASDGALIIKNVTEGDKGTFKAYDTVYRLRRKVAQYQLDVKPGESPEELVTIWKQAFIDWSASFRTWESCSRDYFREQCNVP